MNIDIRAMEEPVSEFQIQAVEQRLGIVLPDAYKSHLLKHNGGIPKQRVFSFVEDGERTTSCIDWFMAICDGEHNNFEKSYRRYRKRMPVNLTPIARDPGGNQICMSLGGDDAGSIYFWDHETEADDGEPVTYKNCYLIAKSFEEFIAGLTE